LVLLLLGCNPAAQGHPWLSELDAGEGVMASGERLMALTPGLHPLEQTDESTELLIAVHGFASKGYEWIYPLKTLNTQSIGVQFFRWDYHGCPQPGAAQLIAAIKETLTPQTKKIHLVGHSYGGMLLASVMSDWPMDIPVDIHVVAAPLAGSAGQSACEYQPPTTLAAAVTVFEWRTQHQLDGAFKDLDEDPQIISLTHSKVTRLPNEYQGNRLGHNRSISWVADKIVEGRKP
jgi:pimeloyl-ACP methyl ester carboxylesterase